MATSLPLKLQNPFCLGVKEVKVVASGYLEVDLAGVAAQVAGVEGVEGVTLEEEAPILLTAVMVVVVVLLMWGQIRTIYRALMTVKDT